MLTPGIPRDFRGNVHLFIETAIRHRVSPEFMGSRNCVPMAFTAEISGHVESIGGIVVAIGELWGDINGSRITCYFD